MALDGTTEKIRLMSADGQEFEMDAKAANLSETLKNTVEDTGSGAPIPVHNMKGSILSMVVEYCQYHTAHGQGNGVKEPTLSNGNGNGAAAAANGTHKPGEANGNGVVTDEAILQWDKQFVTVDQVTLFELILAANYLNIKSLLDLTCMTVAEMIKGKTPEEIRKTFNIKNDFTPEEEEEVKRENLWAFD